MARRRRAPGTYVQVKVPSELADVVEGLLKVRTLGYRSIAEFVVDATRRRIEEVKRPGG